MNLHDAKMLVIVERILKQLTAGTSIQMLWMDVEHCQEGALQPDSRRAQRKSDQFVISNCNAKMRAAVSRGGSQTNFDG